MAEVSKTNPSSPVLSTSQKQSDPDVQAFLIGCAKIRELELRLEEYMVDVDKRLAIIQVLQKLKQKIIQGGDKFDPSKDLEVLELLKQAREYGLDWKAAGWTTIDERDALIDALQITITGKEGENQTTYMRINRLMSLRSEAANLFSKIVSDSHSQKLKILGRLERR
jgi:hypothetical protein